MNYKEYIKYLLEMADPTDYERSKEWYHGTGNIEGILKTKTIIPGNTTDIKSTKKFTPQYNRSYLTSDIEKALPYAIGCSISCDKPLNKEMYICIIKGLDLKDINPDEDILVDFIHEYFSYNRDYKQWDYYNRLKKEFDDKKINEEEFKKLNDLLYWIKCNSTQIQLSNASEDYGKGTILAKKLVNKMSNDMKYKFMTIGSNIANLGEIPVSEIWQLDIDKYTEIKNDPKNFKKYAKRIIK